MSDDLDLLKYFSKICIKKPSCALYDFNDVILGPIESTLEE
jgi:hypothetical protein